MLRVASLLPSLTEIVCALGGREALVARSHECDYPADVRSLPALTAPKFDPEGSSLAIDQRVRALVRDGLSVYRVDPEGLKATRPDVILTQDQCEVCAAGIADVEIAVADWLGDAPRVLSLAPRRIDDVWNDVERIGAALDIPERGSSLAQQLRERTAKLSEQAAATDSRPRLICVEWIEPLMAAGNWMPELVELAGGIPVFGESGELSPWITWDDIVKADPDVMLVMPCGFDIQRTRVELPILEALPGYRTLRAVREGRVFIADGNQYFNRSGPRLLDSLQILAELLHPECFDFGHRGRTLLRA